MKKITLFLFLLIVFSTGKIFSQNLPHWLTDEERARLPSYLMLNNTIRGTDPPDFTPRASAEWEEIQGLMITWTSFTSILKQIVDDVQEECPVYIVCTDSNSVKTSLTSAGIPLTNVKFLVKGFNSIWCRDYGPWNIYKNNDQDVSLIDWIYNRPRPLDDVIPGAIANLVGLPVYQTTQAPYDLVHTGGNFMCDGHGTGFSSKLIMLDNGPGNDFNASVKTEAQIDTIMKKYMGINRYVMMDTLPYDVIHHIDMHIKLLDEETLLVGDFPQGTGDGPQIEANVQYIQDNYSDCYGRPYKIVHIPMVPDLNGHYPPTGNAFYRTYTNSVIVNKSIIVPTYREEYDTTAIRIYKETLPGYKIFTIDCDDAGAQIISQLGAIHCITKEIAHNDPIRISHAPLENTFDAVNPYLVEAKIETQSGVTDAIMYWSADTSIGYNPVTMTAEPNDSFYAYIPAQPAGTQVFYYINAESNSGRNVSKPLTAPQGWWKFMVQEITAIAHQDENISVFYDPYPNPAGDGVNFGFTTNENVICDLKIVDLYGRIVSHPCDGIFSHGIHKYAMDVKDLPAGIYYVVFSANGKIVSKKLLVNH